MIQGMTVKLHEKIKVGEDPFHMPVYEEQIDEVANVLVAPTASVDNPSNTNLQGSETTYTLAIPKGDNHKWENAVVEFFGKLWRVEGEVVEGIEQNIPLLWNKKVTVKRYV